MCILNSTVSHKIQPIIAWDSWVPQVKSHITTSKICTENDLSRFQKPAPVSTFQKSLDGFTTLSCVQAQNLRNTSGALVHTSSCETLSFSALRDGLTAQLPGEPLHPPNRSTSVGFHSSNFSHKVKWNTFHFLVELSSQEPSTYE